jgi:hypothetical protein
MVLMSDELLKSRGVGRSKEDVRQAVPVFAIILQAFALYKRWAD